MLYKEELNKQKKYEEDTYIKNARNIKNNAQAIYIVSAHILGDYIMNWNSAIVNHKSYDVFMNITNHDDSYFALEDRVQYHCLNVIAIKDANKDIAWCIKNIEKVPTKYENLNKELKDIHQKTSEIVSLCQSPTANISEFEETATKKLSALKAALKVTDKYIKTNDRECEIILAKMNIDSIIDAYNKSSALEK